MKEIMLGNQSFSQVYQEQQGPIFGYNMRRLKHLETAQDLTGEVFLRALKSADRYQDQGKPVQHWLMIIAANNLHDYFRGLHSQSNIEDLVMVDHKETTDPQRQAELAEMHDILNKALMRLKPVEREALELHYLKEMDWEEVAKMIGYKYESVRTLGHRTLKKLRKYLEVDYERAIS